MARDFKSAARDKQTRTSNFGSWLSFITGLAIGLTATAIVYFGGFGQRPSVARPATAIVPGSVPEPVAPVQEDHSAMTPAAAGVEEAPQPKFDFYKILPEIEVTVPEEEIANPAPATTATKAETGAYILQVGSFQRFEDADQAKAQLALQGVTSSIQRVVIDGQDIWFRVHVGPYANLKDVQAMRARLVQAGSNVVVLKIGGGPG